jgi:hypothetical protein
LFVFVVGFTSIKKWFEGELNPKQAVSEIRKSISNVIDVTTADSNRKELPGNLEHDATSTSTIDDKDISDNQSKDNHDEYSTDQIASELQKKITN